MRGDLRAALRVVVDLDSAVARLLLDRLLGEDAERLVEVANGSPGGWP